MFYMMGMHFIDLAWLRMHDIKGGRLEYTRRKTRQSYSIKITDKAFKILEHYQKGEQVGSTEFIFPILKKSDVRDAIKANKIYKNRLKYFNRDLKEIAQMAGISVNLTSYYSRHSWATIGKLKGINIEILKQGLGHNNISTTEIYLDQFPNELMDEAYEQITNLDD